MATAATRRRSWRSSRATRWSSNRPSPRHRGPSPRWRRSSRRSWLDERRGLPTFLYVHTMDPHVPYTPPEPFNMKYEPHPTPEHPAVDPRGDYKEPADLDRLVAQYDGEIAYGDREFGRFVAELKRRGLYDRALVVFLGDHGEEFLDHGQFTHGKTVFDELIHIPMIVKFPDRRGGGQRVKQHVQEV